MSDVCSSGYVSDRNSHITGYKEYKFTERCESASKSQGQGSLRAISSRSIPVLLSSFAALEDDAIRGRHPVVAAASRPRINFTPPIANENDLAVYGLRWR